MSYIDHSLNKIRVLVGGAAHNLEDATVLELPTTTEQIKQAVKISGGEDGDYRLLEWECAIESIVFENSRLEILNKVAERMAGLTKNELYAIDFLRNSCALSIDEAFEYYKKCKVFEGDVRETVYQLFDENFFPKGPGSFWERYIDFDKLTRDLEIEGYRYDPTKNRTFYFAG